MRERTDPLVPLLASAVSVVVIAAIVLVFYPRVKAWLGPAHASVVNEPLSPSARVPVWVHRPSEGVALVLTAGREDDGGARFEAALTGGPYRFLHLTVYNFSRDRYVLELPADGFASPGGGAKARPAAAVLRKDAPAHLKAVLQGLGLVQRLEVAKGHRGQALLVVAADPKDRTAFTSGGMRLERRELERQVLARWQQRPDWAEFEDF